MTDEGCRDDDRDVGGGAAEASDHDRHESDENGDIDATADRAECVDPEVTANARGRPVAIHARNRTLAPEVASPKGPRGGYLGSISRTEVRPRPVSTRSRTKTAARSVAAGSAGSAGPSGRAEPARSARTELGRASRARCGRADDHATIRVHADRLRLHAGRALHREVHDPPLVREHRLERDGLPARLHARRNAASDLAKLVLAASAIAFDIQR